MIRVLLDQGLPPILASMLRDDGWDAVHVRERGMQSARDEDIIALAAAESRVCITLDRDFPQTLALTSAGTPSVVLIRRQRLKARSLAGILSLAFERYSVALDRGAVVTIRAHTMTARILPIK